MGIDKANVRTVVHTALPGSVEAFYQEIGRAGRDGLPSRSVLLHSFADRKMHQFFLERDYPPADDLARVAKVLTDESLPPDAIAEQLHIDLDSVNKIVEKPSPRARPPSTQPEMCAAQQALHRPPQARHRNPGGPPTSHSSAIAARSWTAWSHSRRPTVPHECIVRHFGDTADAHRPCGKCDFCSPSTANANSFAPPTTAQARDLRTILRALGNAPSRATGKLHTDLAPSLESVSDRRGFDTLLDALARAGPVTLTAQRSLTPRAASCPIAKPLSPTKAAPAILPASQASSCRRTLRTTQMTARLRDESCHPVLRAKSAPDPTQIYTLAQQQLDDALRAWRRAEAGKTGKPAFIVLSDAVIRNLAFHLPKRFQSCSP